MQALQRLADRASRSSTFMTGGAFTLAGAECFVTRSGYTGEDGFEISVPADAAVGWPRRCWRSPRSSRPAWARATRCGWRPACACTATTSTRHTTPVEAGLTWAIQKVRRPGGARAGHYPGADKIAGQLASGVQIKRVGLVGLERIPVREGAMLVDAHGHKLGHVTSGTLAPTVNQPIAMAYLAANHAIANHEVYAEVRGKRQPMRVASMPFVPPGYVEAEPLAIRTPLNQETRPMTTMFTPDHEWINIEDHEAAVVGITLHAQDALGDVVFVDLPEVGKTYKKGEVVGVVESVKAAADIYMPVEGEVVEVNEALRADPALANSDPMGKAGSSRSTSRTWSSSTS